MDTYKKLSLGAWSLSAAVAAIAFIAWGQGLEWRFAGLSAYQLFPLLGLLAFSVMWSHYMVSVARQALNADRSATKQYFKTTSSVVLILILLHPGLLIWQTQKDTGKIFPFAEVIGYAGPAMRWVVLLGTVSLFAFLAFELHRWYSGRRWWKYIAGASDIAMLAIFYHGLRLGSDLQAGWFRYVWFFYGVTLVAALGYIYKKKLGALKQG